MESSTNSAVNTESPSRFRYFERDGVVWGDYEGDTVTFGQFVGTRTRNDLQVSFVHVMSSNGDVVAGTGSNVVETLHNGSVRLIERFWIEGEAHESVCVEV